jgi:hypothetical protein
MKKNLFLICVLLIVNYTFAQNNFEEEEELQKFKKEFVISGGLLFGGGSLIGADLEFRLHKKLTGQVGLGFRGFGAGINLHYEKDLHSNFISFQYYHQGIGQYHVQSLIGPTYNFRAFKYIAGSIGLGRKVMEGPAYYNLPSQYRLSTLLLYSIGFYKVF